MAAVEAKLGLPEVGLGLLRHGGTQRLTRLCGRGIASRLILGGEVIDGAFAERLGVVQWAQPRHGLPSGRGLCGHTSLRLPACARFTEQCLAASGDPHRDGFAEETRRYAETYQHPETRRESLNFLTERNGGLWFLSFPVAVRVIAEER